MDATGLTPREREVLTLLGEHLTHEQIGQRLFISVRTVESHVASLRRKLGTPDHRALVRHAVEQRSLPAVAALPVALTSFVGRVQELEKLRAALGAARLVSAVGPGGVGKTRLALAASEGRHALWADLAPVTDGVALEEAVAHACGAVFSDRLGPVEATIAALRGHRVLLVLDNCEHLANAAAVLVERLLAATSELTVLVTSRVRLVLPFEQVIRIDGMSVEVGGDAVALFVERAVAAGAPPPTAAELVRISRVCEVLGGLALAIEMAAARLPSLGLDGVERGLLDQGALLTGGARLSPRHRSMSDTLDWSTSLLPESAAATLRRVSVLVAPFHADAAVAVAAFGSLTADDVRDALARLTEHNLLSATPSEGGLLHRMLEPVRQYGIARMTVEDQQAFGHHAAWVTQRLESLELPGISDDARAALARALVDPRTDPVTHELARRFGRSLFRAGSLREAQLRMEQAAMFVVDGSADLADAAAVAKCRVDGADAFRLELLAADCARDPVAAALAIARAAEMLTRFPGMFGQLPERSAASLLDEARELAPADARVAAGIAVAQAGYLSTDPRPAPERAQYALELARNSGDLLLESSALDAMTSSDILSAQIMRAYRRSTERVRLVATLAEQPAGGLELKDALHVASFCALGAGDLATARAMAYSQRDLPFLAERHDLAEDELLCAAALGGDWAAVFAAGERFLADWTGAGRPVAPGRGMSPAAVALAHGLQDNAKERRAWLEVLAEIRGVPVQEAARGTGYGELFEAMVLLHHAAAADAFDVLTAPGDRGLYGFVFGQWTAALTAEAAVLARRPDATDWFTRAEQASEGNPVATAITRRATMLSAGGGDPDLLAAITADFAAAGAMYHAERTSALATHRQSGPRRARPGTDS
jgi:predicted ATPase/DNA-binding CsgD family transcriptional regulator